MFSYYTAALVFFTYIWVDILYAYYIICVERRQPLRAAAVSSFLYSLLAFGVVSYSQCIWYLVPLASGAFIGTYLTVWWQSHGKEEGEAGAREARLEENPRVHLPAGGQGEGQ